MFNTYVHFFIIMRDDSFSVATRNYMFIVAGITGHNVIMVDLASAAAP